MEINIWIALLAGLLSFFSPCVFSLIPVYLTYLSGRTISAPDFQSTPKQRLSLFLHGLSFVLGFSTIFILLGLAASTFGNLLYDSKEWVSRIGGVLVILFGLHVSGILNMPFLNYEFRAQTGVSRKFGYLTTFIMGVFFSAGWSPCYGPVLGAILVLAASEGSMVNGTILLAAYSIGMAIPFLLSTILVEFLNSFIKRFKQTAVVFEKIFGFFLILIGLLLFFGIFERMAQFSSFLDFGI
jgi:cytochrome c-type biogenesis protein